MCTRLSHFNLVLSSAGCSLALPCSSRRFYTFCHRPLPWAMLPLQLGWGLTEAPCREWRAWRSPSWFPRIVRRCITGTQTYGGV